MLKVYGISSNKEIYYTLENKTFFSIQSNNPNIDQKDILNLNETIKSPKRIIKERPLTEEQRKKREEYFLKEEEWERNVEFESLTDKGIIKPWVGGG